MNCLEFRRLKLTDPNRLTPAALEHAAACPSCADFNGAQDAFERELLEAVNVAADPALAARVLLRRRLKHAGYRRVFARAAVVLLICAALISAGVRLLTPEPAMFSALAAHVAHEPNAFKADEHRTHSDLAAALSASGARIVRPIKGDISYIHPCPVPGGMGKHIVIRIGAGTITLLTMPNKNVYFRKVKTHEGYAVAVLPCKRGSVALVAKSEAELTKLEAQLRDHVQWQT